MQSELGETIGFDCNLRDYRSHHGLPHTTLKTQCFTLDPHPGFLAEDSFIPLEHVEQEVLSNYFDEDGDKIALSRTTPARCTDYPVGTWRKSGFKGFYGHEIEVLLEIDPKDKRIIDSENAGVFRIDDVIRYRSWLSKGLIPPPITVVETDKGRLKIVDGHRRFTAAKWSNVAIKAWVSPTVLDTNQNLSGLTLEIAQSLAKEINIDGTTDILSSSIKL